jgi:membrane associated rhomboid family serine protease
MQEKRSIPLMGHIALSVPVPCASQLGGIVLPSHLISNMLALYIFCDNVEDRLGSGRYVFLYLTCGLAAALVHFAFNPSSVIPTIGASGAISGVLATYSSFHLRV